MEEILLKVAGEGGWLAAAVIMLIWLARNLTQNQTINTTTVAGLASVISEMSEANKESAAANKASALAFGEVAQTLASLKTRADDTSTMVDGFRREVQGVHADQIETLRNLQQVVALIPDVTAGKVKDDLMPPLQNIREQLASAATQIASACLKLDQLVILSSKSAPAEPPGETAIEQPETKQAAQPAGEETLK